MTLPALFPPWLAHIPLGWIVFAIVAFILTIDAMRSGPGRAAVLAITAPASVFLYDLIPHTFVIGSLMTSLPSRFIPAGIFLVIFIIVFILFYRMAISIGGISSGLMLSLLAGLSGTIVSVVMWLQVPALSSIWDFGAPLPAIFGSPYALFWLVISFIALAFARS